MSTELANRATKGFEIEINGFKIKSDAIYQIIPKPDEDAPSGFRKERTTKVLSPRISESFGCVYNSTTQTWDTGFYEYSPCYKKMSVEERQARVEAVTKNIKEPMEAIYGGSGDKLHQNNNEFWDEYKVEIMNGKVIDTSEPKQLFDLYLAILHNKVAPKENATGEALQLASYGIIDKEEVISRKEQREFDKNTAIGNFYMLLKSDKKKLITILNYLNLFVDENSSEVALNNVMTNYFEDKTNAEQNVEIFNETLELANSENGKKELAFFVTLKQLYKKGVVKKDGSDYMLGETKLGSSFRLAAKKVATDTELQEQIVNLLD